MRWPGEQSPAHVSLCGRRPGPDRQPNRFGTTETLAANSCFGVASAGLSDRLLTKENSTQSLSNSWWCIRNVVQEVGLGNLFTRTFSHFFSCIDPRELWQECGTIVHP